MLVHLSSNKTTFYIGYRNNVGRRDRAVTLMTVRHQLRSQEPERRWGSVMSHLRRLVTMVSKYSEYPAQHNTCSSHLYTPATSRKSHESASFNSHWLFAERLAPIRIVHECKKISMVTACSHHHLVACHYNYHPCKNSKKYDGCIWRYLSSVTVCAPLAGIPVPVLWSMHAARHNNSNYNNTTTVHIQSLVGNGI